MAAIEQAMSEADRGRAVDVLVKEVDYLSRGVVAAVDTTRRLVLSATYIAGFGVPLLVTILNAPGSADVLTVLRQKSEIILFVLVAEMVTCLAVLHIYVGNFRQIFTTARYLREHSVVSIQKLMPSSPVKLLYWEKWIQERRVDNQSVGDLEMYAEPLIIAFYTLTYAALFVMAVVRSVSTVWVIVLAAAIVLAVLLLTLRCLVQVRRIVSSAQIV